MRSLICGKRFLMLNVTRALLDFFFPSQCRICEGSLNGAKWVCNECLAKIKTISSPYCYRCGISLADIFLEVEEPFCKECKSQPRYFHQARAVAIYEGVMRECIHLFKYAGKRALSEALGELMVVFIDDQWGKESFDLIVPVPLHPRRKRERGFNQAELLTLPVKTHLNIPIDTKNLIRNRPTRTQTTLDRKERIENVKGAFEIRALSPFTDRHILLVDDIFTTGATLNECSRTLMEAGARKVYALTLARAI